MEERANKGQHQQEELVLIVVASGNTGAGLHLKGRMCSLSDRIIQIWRSIAYDLFEAGARTSVVVQNTIHLVTKEIWLFGMRLMNYLSLSIVDQIMLFLCYLRFGNTAKYCLRIRPDFGPLYMLMLSSTRLDLPVIDVVTYDRIKTREIQVLPSLTSIERNMVTFANGKTHHFDAIIFATGYRSTIQQWLETDEGLIGDDGFPKGNYPDNWKGRNGLYFTGFGRRGLYGSSEDALLIANNISNDYVHSLRGS